MSSTPVNIYYAPCREHGCWLLFKNKPRVPFDSKCSVHGHELQINGIFEGMVTELEAARGWTKQRPD